MSVLIKGMSMPEHGSITITIHPNGFVQHFSQKPSYVGEFPKIYHAISVPPHGDLIDRSELLKKETDFGDCEYAFYCVATEHIEEAPIVIPAELSV